MKKVKFNSFATAIFCCMFAITMMTSCDNSDDKTPGLEFNPSKVESTVDLSTDITVSGGTAPYSVVSSDEKIATVKADQNVITVTGVTAGVATLTVTDKNNLSGKVVVTVKEAVAGLNFDKNTVDVTVENEDVVTIKDGEAPYIVAVADAAIATATEKDGKITIKGVKAGTTTVSVTDKNKKSGTITVTVK